MSITGAVAAEIVGSVSTGLDSLFTSDEERLQAQNVFKGIEQKINESMNNLQAKIQEAVSSRHTADMMSDSWLSKNIRPLTLITMTLATLYLVFFVNPESEVAIAAYQLKLGLLTSLDLLMYGFYFGSRGVEKVAASVAALMNKPKKPKKDDFSEDDDW